MRDGGERRWSIAEGTMRPDLVVSRAPSFDQRHCLLQAVEDLEVQQLVPELAVEAFAVAVFPGTARLDERASSRPRARATRAPSWRATPCRVLRLVGASRLAR